MYHRIICADGYVFFNPKLFKGKSLQKIQILLYRAISESYKKFQISYVLLRYDVQSRRIWIATFLWNVPH